MPVTPTVDLIASKQLVEGADYEFKRQLNFDDQGKSNLVDDVVAFLNTEKAGHIIVGVKEDKGGFAGFAPILEDPDQLIRRVQSLLQDKIAPRPLGVEVRALPVDGGSILDIAIGEHRMGPYQNLFTGGLMIRTGAKNTPVRLEELKGYITSRDQYDEIVLRRMALEGDDLEASGRMVPQGAVLDIGILPREHFDRGRPSFHQPHFGMVKSVPGFHWERPQVFRGAASGHEAMEEDTNERGLSRVLVADDWFIHARVVHPIGSDHHRIKLPEFRDKLMVFLQDLDQFVEKEGLRGPFAVQLSLHRLHSDETFKLVFKRSGKVALARPGWTASIADADLVDQFISRVRSISVYG